MFLHEGFILNIEKYKARTDGQKDMVVYNYHHLLHELLFDMVLLLRAYDDKFDINAIEQKTFMKNPYQHNLTLYKSIPQMIFGQESFHSFIETSPQASITLIRQVLELRIRDAFGVMGIYDQKRNAYEPFPMNQIFEVLNKFKNEIEFAIPLEHIKRINGWANIYVHSGLQEYSWLLIFIYRYISPLIHGVGGQEMNIASGIKLSTQTLQKVQKEFRDRVEIAGRGRVIMGSRPEVDLI